MTESWGRAASHKLPRSFNGSTLLKSQGRTQAVTTATASLLIDTAARCNATRPLPSEQPHVFLETALESFIEGSLPERNVDPNSEILVAEKSVRLWFSCLILRCNYFAQCKEGIRV